MSEPSRIHSFEVEAQSAHQLPYGATSEAPVLLSSASDLPRSLQAGTKTMLRYQPPLPPACTQWPANHTRLDLPGWLTSLMTVPEQTAGPSGESKKTLPTGAAFSWYGVFWAVARTGAGCRSLTPWPAGASFVVTVLSASFADCMR
ncbi:hypothetical protein H8R17_27940 [Streptomyces sp. TRM68367]|nr:hypothetical protein [Streptomyces sp. TRM68367]